MSLMRMFCEKFLCLCAADLKDVYKEIILHEKDTGVPLGSRVILVSVYGLITLLSLVGNSLVIITFAFDRNMRSVTNVFILSLAVADLLVTLACVPINIGSVFTTFWIFGSFMCKFFPFLMTFSVACSSLTLCSIALDRYIAIVHPYKLKFLQNPKPAAILLIFIWVVACICSMPNLIFYQMEEKYSCPNAGVDKTYVCFWPDNKYKLPLEIWLTFVVLFIVPFIIMSGAYGLIGYHLWIRKPIGNRRNSIRNVDMKKSVIKMLLIVMLAFVLSWSPIMVLNAVENTNKHHALSSYTLYSIRLYFQVLSMTSCCINPIIYTFMNRKFRQKFASYLFCRNKRVSPIETIASQEMTNATRQIQQNKVETVFSKHC